MWPNLEYTGSRGITECSATGLHHLNGSKLSIKNRCSDREVTTSGAGEPSFCVNAQNNSETLGFAYIEVGPANSHC